MSDTKQKTATEQCVKEAHVRFSIKNSAVMKVMYGNGHQLLEVKLLEATMRGFTGSNIFHALEHVTSRYVGR